MAKPIKRGVALLALLVLGVVSLTHGQPSKPTVYYYEARGQSLLAVEPADGGRPAFLIFPDHCRFNADYALRLGEALFPGDAIGREEHIRQFQQALQTSYSAAAQVSGAFDLNTVEQIHRSADRLPAESDLGPVHVVQLNKVLQSPNGAPALRALLSVTMQTGSLSDVEINRCRETMERNLNVFVERSDVKLVQGPMLGIFGLAECSGNRTDSDGDGLYDLDEVNLYGTDPHKVDTDGDGIPDGEEVAARSRGIMLDPTKRDTDGDGLTDKQEMDLRARGVMVDPARADTDGDGLSDKQELEARFHGRPFDPTNPHTFPGALDDKQIYDKYVLNQSDWPYERISLIVAALLIAGGAATIVFVKRNHRNAGSAPSRWRRRAYVRRTVLSTPPAMTKAEVGGETPGMRKAASETIDRRVEPAPSPAVVDRARVADVEPLRPSRAAAENDELVAVRERLARLDRTLQEFERKAAPDENARRLDAITLRLDKVAASLIQLEQRDGRRDGSTDRDLALWQAKLQPAIEGLRRLDQLEAAVRTLEHISFAKTQRDEELGARIATLEESKSRLPGPPTSEVVVAPLSNQIRELAQSVSDWKASVTATLQTIVAENESLKDRLARSNDTPAKAAAAAPPMPAGDGHAEFGELKERIDAIGRVIAELNLKVERIPAAKQPEEISRRLELLEQKLAHGPSDATGDATGAPADLLRKVKDVEQMVVRSMSEWGRLFNDLEERMARNERAAKLKK